MKILAIESTCDETSAAVVEIQTPRDSSTSVGMTVSVLSNVVASSVEIHEKYGGIVPEVAAREQIKSILPVINEALIHTTPYPPPKLGGGNRLPEIEAIAVASGPGLIGSLLIGIETAKTLALAWEKPLIPINHMVGHVMSNWIGATPRLPAVALVVSGGHTDLIYMKDLNNWEWIGGTRDDAAGECLDKCARILGLGYPGGPAIQQAAERVNTSPQPSPNLGEGARRLPRPMLDQDNLDVSFSGIKSALSQEIGNREKDLGQTEKNLWAREVNEAVVEVLVTKTLKAIKIYQPKSVILAGGVAANSLLRSTLKEKLEIPFYLPELKYCGDNAAMVGAAVLRVDKKDWLVGDDILKVRPQPGLTTV